MARSRRFRVSKRHRREVAGGSHFLAVSLKMYFGYAQTVDWCERVSTMARQIPALADGLVELTVFPSFAALKVAVGYLRRDPVSVGAQDMFWQDNGPFTGEVGGPELREVGCRFVEMGHSERRRFFGETNETWRANWRPLLAMT